MLFTVITINLNNAIGLTATIESVVNQSFNDFEHLIIDGNSSDNSLEIIKHYVSDTFHWVSENDNGIYDAMNKGIAMAKGEWIIFMNSGDVFCNNQVLKQISDKINPDDELVYGNTIVRDTLKRIESVGQINKRYFFYDTICHQSIFIKRDLFSSVGLHDLRYRILADRDFLLRAFIQGIRFRYCDVDVCSWESVGYSSQNRERIKEEEIILRESYFSLPERLCIRFFKALSFHGRKIVAIIKNRLS